MPYLANALEASLTKEAFERSDLQGIEECIGLMHPELFTTIKDMMSVEDGMYEPILNYWLGLGFRARGMLTEARAAFVTASGLCSHIPKQHLEQLALR
jgi:hypothetical protein